MQRHFQSQKYFSYFLFNEYLFRLISNSFKVFQGLSQIRYSLVVIPELNSGSEVQYKDMMMVDDEKYQ